MQFCHPQSSVKVVEKILADFKAGRRDSADFWINMQGKMIYIRYFAVRDGDGTYLGTVEVTQDITGIRRLEEEKRIYSEADALFLSRRETSAKSAFALFAVAFGAGRLCKFSYTDASRRTLRQNADASGGFQLFPAHAPGGLAGY